MILPFGLALDLPSRVEAARMALHCGASRSNGPRRATLLPISSVLGHWKAVLLHLLQVRSPLPAFPSQAVHMLSDLPHFLQFIWVTFPDTRLETSTR